MIFSIINDISKEEVADAISSFVFNKVLIKINDLRLLVKSTIYFKYSLSECRD